MTLTDELREMWESADVPPSDSRVAKHRLADAVRDLVRAVTLLDSEEVSDGVLDGFTDDVAVIAERVGALPDLNATHGSPARSRGPDGHLVERSPFSGRGNPVAMPMEVEFDGERARGIVTYDEVYEGPPGSVHGGCVTAAFDEVLGVAQIASGAIGMTGTLTIRLRRPTPLHERIVYEAGIDRRNGRKIHVWGSSTDEAGEVLAEAEGLFLSVHDLLPGRTPPPTGS